MLYRLEAVLKDLGTFKPWAPPSLKATPCSLQLLCCLLFQRSVRRISLPVPSSHVPAHRFSSTLCSCCVLVILILDQEFVMGHLWGKLSHHLYWQAPERITYKGSPDLLFLRVLAMAFCRQ